MLTASIMTAVVKLVGAITDLSGDLPLSGLVDGPDGWCGREIPRYSHILECSALPSCEMEASSESRKHHTDSYTYCLTASSQRLQHSERNTPADK